MEKENGKSPKKKRKRKLPRILVEWICSKCDQVHRISLPYRFKAIRGTGQAVMSKWGTAKVKKLWVDPTVTLSEMNEFLNSLFFKKFHAVEYVKIRYPERLLEKLKENALVAQNHRKFYEVL